MCSPTISQMKYVYTDCELKANSHTEGTGMKLWE